MINILPSFFIFVYYIFKKRKRKFNLSELDEWIYKVANTNTLCYAITKHETGKQLDIYLGQKFCTGV